MIFYFSGTGNSAWVARQLAEGQNEELLSIAMEIDRNKAYKLKEGEKVGFVFLYMHGDLPNSTSFYSSAKVG